MSIGYLGIIEARATTETGSQWTIRNYRKLKKQYGNDDALIMLCKTMHQNQLSNTPLHEWSEVASDLQIHETSSLVGHIMDSNLFTVDEEDLADLATQVMKWKNIHHLPVDNKAGDFCGLLTWTHMKNHRMKSGDTKDTLVSEIMTTSVFTVSPDTPIKEAIALMKSKEIGCLPVIQDHSLVGMLTIPVVLPYDKD